MTHSGSDTCVSISRILLSGNATGVPLVFDEPISFWGGIDPSSGNVIDVHHPQHGSCIAGRIVFLPGTRGSTAGPGALLEALFAGHGPAAIVLTRPDVSALIAITAGNHVGVTAVPVVEAEGVLPKCLHTCEKPWRLDCAMGYITPLQVPAIPITG